MKPSQKEIRITPSPASVRENDGPTSERAKTGSAILTGIIERITLDRSGYSMEMRLVEWVEGSDNQEQTALEQGRCTLEGIENDECLPNGFYLRQTEKRITLPIAKDAVIRIYARNGERGMIPNEEGNIYLKMISADGFARVLKSDQIFALIPFEVVTTDGKVIEIQERYVP